MQNHSENHTRKGISKHQQHPEKWRLQMPSEMLIIRSASQGEAGTAGAQLARDSRLNFEQNNDWGLALWSRSRIDVEIKLPVSLCGAR